MLLANKIAGFINQPYLKSNRFNKHDFLHADIDGRKLKIDLEICSGVGSKILLSNQIAKFLKKPFLKKDEVSQLDVLYFDRYLGKVNHDLLK